MLGLFAFTHALAHFLCYAVVDQGLAIDFIIEDVTKRPYITVGFTALLLLLVGLLTASLLYTSPLQELSLALREPTRRGSP